MGQINEENLIEFKIVTYEILLFFEIKATDGELII